MPNINNPHGLFNLGRTLGGGCPVFRTMNKAAGYAVPLYPGDVVHRVADGSIESNSATPGTTLYSGVNAIPAPASTASQHQVCISPDTLYEAQDDGAGGGIVAADLGLNANLVLNAGSALLGHSGHVIGAASKAVTATLDLHLLELLGVVGNEHGANARIVVTFNKHRMAPGVAGV